MTKAEEKGKEHRAESIEHRAKGKERRAESLEQEALSSMPYALGSKLYALSLEWLGERLNPQLYRHSIATQELAAELADIYNVDRQKAVIAGLLHDCARGLSNEELLSHADRYHIPLDHVQLSQPVLLHAPVGARLVQMELGITDNEILHAVAAHSTGSKGMSRLDKVLYVADSSEPNRDYPGVQHIRDLASSGDLDGALLKAMEIKIRYVMGQKLVLHPLSMEAWNDILKGSRKKELPADLRGLCNADERR
jgi:predicted HD superfamily hydrolase involved in NAD metabolism